MQAYVAIISKYLSKNLLRKQRSPMSFTMWDYNGICSLLRKYLSFFSISYCEDVATRLIMHT